MVKDKKSRKMVENSGDLDNNESFPIVALGSSAGGLEANESFFRNMPPDSDMAYVIITHLEPHHPSLLADIISKATTMETLQVQDGMVVQKNKIYVIPPGKYMMITDGTLHLIDRDSNQEQFLPIDRFLRSLADDRKENSIAIILSGNASDGSFGIKEIHANLGMVMAQSPDTANYNSMPKSAIETGFVDYVLPPSEMPGMLLKYIDALRTNIQPPRPEPIESKSGVEKILSIVKSETGHDFSLYKKSTINRRVERRMTVHQLESKKRYANYLVANPQEIHLLFNDLLIDVTSFFRNPDAFESLKENLRKTHFASSSTKVIRAWIAGCSSGEEAYSIAIILRELMEETGMNPRVQIFGSDINEDAINRARTGDFPLAIADDIDAMRLERYFIKHENGYKLRKEVRDMAVFATHDLNRDPPFLHLDILSCRNLLIYFEHALQKRVLETFSAALNPGGILFLGETETINGFDDRFNVLDPVWKIYRRREYAQIPPIGQTFVRPRQRQGVAPTKVAPERKTSLSEKVERILLSEHTPTCLIVNEKNEVIYFHGRTSRYLEPAQGKASLNIRDLIREDILYIVMSAIDESRTAGKPVQKEEAQVHSNNDATFLNIIIKPLEVQNPVTDLLIIFDEKVIPQNIMDRQDLRATSKTDARIEELKKELSYTKNDLRKTIEQLEHTNEELTSTNEELQSNNEELQSVAEESETGKEELSSLNEELLTVNSELERKNRELSRTNSDMRNILNSIDEAIIFVDIDLRIRRYTPLMETIMNLLPGDVGRPIQDIATKIRYENLVAEIEKVLDTLNTIEREIQTNDGHWFKLKILPYRTIDNVIDGAVITFSDIDFQKKAQSR